MFISRRASITTAPRPFLLPCFEVIAVRLRLKAFWLTIGLLLVAWTGAAARIDANRETVHQWDLDMFPCRSTFGL